MDCTHETPGGSRYCGLCRRQVLAEAGQWRPKAAYLDPDPRVYRPMPSDFRSRVDAARAAAATHHPTLEDA